MNNNEIINEVHNYLKKDMLLSNILSSYSFLKEDPNYLKSLILLLYIYKYVNILNNKHSLFSNELNLQQWIVQNIFNFTFPEYCKDVIFKEDIIDKKYYIRYNKEVPSSYTIFEDSTFAGEIICNEFNKDKYFYIRNDFILDTLGKNNISNIFNFKLTK